MRHLLDVHVHVVRPDSGGLERLAHHFIALQHFDLGGDVVSHVRHKQVAEGIGGVVLRDRKLFAFHEDTRPRAVRRLGQKRDDSAYHQHQHKRLQHDVLAPSQQIYVIAQRGF